MKVVIICGSNSDGKHVEKIVNELKVFNIESVIRICSAHKQLNACVELLNEYNNSKSVIFVSVAGGTDALSGVLSFGSVFPVISCPPNDKDYVSCLKNPKGSSNSLILKPSNLAKHCAQILNMMNGSFKEKILELNNKKISELENYDRR